ncbi:HDOD domain-containing protein [Vogesella facilis]|uniref:HDOD domain-containing protein n=1 Tax=Vogesella facilis TaxID=1655232 RepID=A0ABV7RC90_9NEIS
MELANWLSSLSENRWPVLSDTAGAVRRMMLRHPDEIVFSELANLTLSDPFLLLDLLRLVGASSAVQRSESNPTVEQMLMMLGLEAVKKRYAYVQAFSVSRGKLDAEVLDALGGWLGKSRVAAFLIKDWLAMIGETRVEDCFIAALVYNLPACLYLVYRNRVPQGPLLQEVSDVFGQDYPKLLEQFIRHMPLPSGLLATLGTGPVSRRRQLLKLAIATANGIDQGCWRSQWNIGVEAAARLIGCTPEAVHKPVQEAVLRVARHPRAPGYAYPARAYLWLEGPFPQAVEQQPVATLSGEAQLELALRESIRHFANDLKLERIFFLRYEQLSHTLKLRYQVGLDDNDPLRKLAVTLEPGSFFNLLASKAQSFHAPAGARAQLAHRYGDEFLSLLGNGAFAAMSVFTGHKLAGVFVVDNYRSNKPIDDDTYQRFKETVARVSQIAL